MYCFSPHSINFDINKSDPHRTACHNCLWKHGFTSRIFIKIVYTGVLRADTVLLSGDGRHRQPALLLAASNLFSIYCLVFIIGIMQANAVCILSIETSDGVSLSMFSARTSGKMQKLFSVA